MDENRSTYEFQSEAKQVLDLMIHSVYSNPDIFLRELVSNASDALDKLRLESLSDEKLADAAKDGRITVSVDKERKTVTVSDNGIGMTKDELVSYLGTIARSGTKEFIASLREAGGGDLIGQFGVGFYSSFIAADRVTVKTRRAGSDEAWLWDSAGGGSFTIEPSDRDGWGSDVILRIKDREPEDDASAGRDYLSVWTLREIIKKYSDFVSYPIYLEDFSDKKDDDKKPEPVNSMKAIWIRPESEVQGEEYREFYRHISHDWEEPMERIVYRAEGKSEFHALLFIPSRPPFDLFYRDGTHGIQLYIRRVFIMNDCKDVIPEYMRFLKGVVDSEDLPLNISREILQQDRQTAMIKRGVVRKVLDSLKKMKSDRPEDFAKFWSMFGEVVKEGIVSDPKNRDAILKLALFSGSKSGRTSLEDYAAKMADGQKSIYYLTGGRGETLSASPKLEAFTDRGIDVLLLNDPIDEIWLSSSHEFDSHPFVSVSAENVEIEGSPAEKSAEIADSFLSGLKEAVKSLGLDSVEDVKLSARLVDSPATFVQKGEGVSAQMRNFFKAMGQEAPPERKVLEINASHPLVRKMTEAELDDGGRRDMAVLLTGLASISDGEPVADARRFTKTLERLLEK